PTPPSPPQPLLGGLPPRSNLLDRARYSPPPQAPPGSVTHRHRQHRHGWLTLTPPHLRPAPRRTTAPRPRSHRPVQWPSSKTPPSVELPATCHPRSRRRTART
ncbi:unnamed protein product, partial [Ectocarpus sp. 13 AM-2016]